MQSLPVHPHRRGPMHPCGLACAIARTIVHIRRGAPDVLPGPDASLVVAGRVMAGVARAQGAYCAPCSACGLVFRGDLSVVRAGARGDAFSDGAAQAEDCEVIPEANTLCN